MFAFVVVGKTWRLPDVRRSLARGYYTIGPLLVTLRASMNRISLPSLLVPGPPPTSSRS